MKNEGLLEAGEIKGTLLGFVHSKRAGLRSSERTAQIVLDVLTKGFVVSNETVRSEANSQRIRLEAAEREVRQNIYRLAGDVTEIMLTVMVMRRVPADRTAALRAIAKEIAKALGRVRFELTSTSAAAETLTRYQIVSINTLLQEHMCPNCGAKVYCLAPETSN